MSDIAPHTVTWFEIPVTNIQRASNFYEAVLNVKLQPMEMQGQKMAIFPGGDSTSTHVVHGALVEGETYTPSEQGTLVYLNGGKDLTTPLSRVTQAGGSIIQEKMSIGEHGFIALFKDTEGNRIAFHSVG